MGQNFFTRKPEQSETSANPLQAVDTATVRQAEDGSEILYGLARQLKAAGAGRAYVAQMRNAAHAIHEITQLHPEAGHADEDTAFGAMEHASEIHKRLRPAGN